jgi:hypothetical protein
LYELILLLWRYFELPEILGVAISLHTFVMTHQHHGITTRIFGNSSIADFFARLQSIDLPKRIINSRHGG